MDSDDDDDDEVRGKVYVVTGGNKGIGFRWASGLGGGDQ
jgi:NAD(P)-dependent dehydrogenase (short-subunit alcohol dehydrogenase family)